MDAFDRDRPLWELTLVEGVEDGEAALVVKFHHSLSDGVGGMRMLAIIADLQREPPDLGPMPPAPSGESPGRLTLVSGPVGSMAAQLTGLAGRGAQTAIPALTRAARNPFGLACGTAAMARSVYRTAAPSSGAMSPLMQDRSMTRHLAMMGVSLDALKNAAKIADGTVNDAYLAVVTGGLRRYHERHGAIAGALNMLPVGYVAAILKHADFVASNVPGVPMPVYVAGSKITGMSVFGPTIGTSLNTTLVSYVDTCDIGINIDTAAVPDPHVLVACLEESAAEITALGGAGPARKTGRGP